jgi:hypothetical protein
MIKLEETLIEAAEQALLEAKQFSNDPKNDDLYRNLNQFHAYVYLAHIADSGLSEEATEKLLGLEKQCTEMMKIWMETLQQDSQCSEKLLDSFIVNAITDDNASYEDVISAKNEEEAILEFKEKWGWRDTFRSVWAKPNI